MKGKGILDRKGTDKTVRKQERKRSIQPFNGSVRSNQKSFEKTGPPFEVVLFSRSNRLELWFNGSRPLSTVLLSHLTGDT